MKLRNNAISFGDAPSAYGPQDSPVDESICFGEGDVAHVKRGARFSLQLVKSSDHEGHTNRRPSRAEAALLLWQDTLPFTVSAQAIRDYLEENLANVCYERDASGAPLSICSFVSCNTMIVASFHSCGAPQPRPAAPPPRHMVITIAWNCSSIRWLP